MTAKEKVLKQAPGWTEEQAEAALVAAEDRIEEERAEVGEAIAAGYRRVPQTADEDAWAEGNAREAIRQERW